MREVPPESCSSSKPGMGPGNNPVKLQSENETDHQMSLQKKLKRSV